MTRRPIPALALLLASCSAGGEADKAAAPVALVKLARAEQGTLAAPITLYGAAEASPSAKRALVAPAEGIVVSIDAPVGTQVKQGQVVARLAPSPTTRVDLAKATTDATAATAAFARAQRLRADGLGSDADVETTRAAARSATLTRDSLGARAGGLTIRANAAGLVDTVAPSPGDLVQPGAPIATIARAGDTRARFGIDPAQARALHPGMAIRIATNAGGPPLTVPLESVAPVLDPQTRLATVFARLPAASGISAGQTLTAIIAIGSGGSAVTIPYAALLDDGGQPYVFVVAKGIAHRRDVGVGPVDGGRVAVASGIRPGDAVVVDGGTAVEDGMKVRTR